MTVHLVHQWEPSAVSDAHWPRRGVLARTIKPAVAANANSSSFASALHTLLLCPCSAARGSVQLRAAADRMPYAGAGLKPLMQS